MKKILVFGMSSNYGGVEKFIMNYYQNIDRKFIQFDFLCYDSLPAYHDKIENLGGKIHIVTSRRKNPIKSRIAIRKALKENKYDAIWDNLCSLSDISILRIAKRLGVKTRIIHSHNSMNMSGKFTAVMHYIHKKMIGKLATDFWACSIPAGKWFYNKKILNSTKIVNNAIVTKNFVFDPYQRDLKRKEFHIENNFVIGNIGRFHYQKNHDFLINIFQAIHKKNKNAVLMLVGDGELRPQIEDKIKKLGLSDNVILTGVRSDIPQILQAMDVFLFPSLFEGLPITLVEAQAAGLPCVISDTITEEVAITNLVQYVSLNRSPEFWANTVLQHINNCKRIDTSAQIKSAGYDIEASTKTLENLLYDI